MLIGNSFILTKATGVLQFQMFTVIAMTFFFILVRLATANVARTQVYDPPAVPLHTPIVTLMHSAHVADKVYAYICSASYQNIIKQEFFVESVVVEKV